MIFVGVVLFVCGWMVLEGVNSVPPRSCDVWSREFAMGVCGFCSGVLCCRFFKVVSESEGVVLCWDCEEGWVYGGVVGRVALLRTSLCCWMGVAGYLCFCVFGRLLCICRVS